MERIRTRFAPSPTGYLHIGGLRTALYGYLYAKKYGGDFILRLEDTDRARYVKGADEVIYKTLKDAGILYSEGPDIGGDFGPYIQSQRADIYKHYAKLLVEKGGGYYCFCTPERLSSLADENGNRKYDKHCKSLSSGEVEQKIAAGEKYVIRQDVPLEGKSSYNDLVFGKIEVDFKDIEDGVLLKSDGLPTYNFANVIDDRLMKITHVIRGTEYLSSTPKYNLLYDSFGWERPVYIHLPPIMRNAKEKLSKRHGDASYSDFVNRGFVPEAIINYIALLGWSPKDNTEKMSLAELEKAFSLEGINKSPAIFDEPKLKWLSGEYIKAMDENSFYTAALPYIQKSKLKSSEFDFKKIAALLQKRVEIYSEIPEKINFLVEFDKFDLSLFDNKKMKTSLQTASEILPKVKNLLANFNDFSNAALFEKLSEFAALNGYKSGQVFWCLRVAITGRLSTPGGATEMAEILGKGRVLERLDFSISQIGG